MQHVGLHSAIPIKYEISAWEKVFNRAFDSVQDIHLQHSRAVDASMLANCIIQIVSNICIIFSLYKSQIFIIK